MIANYHTHTWRCNHAFGTEEAYIRAAIDEGLVLLGFSDHAPYCFPAGYCSGFRMEHSQLSGYADTVRRLSKAYGDRIDIPLGLEIEYYPRFFSETLELLREQGVEYLLLGQHFLENELDGENSREPTVNEDVLARYCAQVMDAMQTGLFTYVAHPDLLCYVGSDKVYARYMRLLCREAKNCGLPLELNLLGMRQGRNYPDERFWALAGEEGCQVILGCDAHNPDDLRCRETEKQARELAHACGLNIVDTVPLHGIG